MVIHVSCLASRLIEMNEIDRAFCINTLTSWRTFCVQGKGEVNVEEVTESCEHVYEVKNDVGRACSQCGLIKVDIKDMTFMWRRPVPH